MSMQIFYWHYTKFTKTLSHNVRFKNISQFNYTCNHYSLRNYSESQDALHTNKNENKSITFVDMVKSRQAEARRSILVQVQSAGSSKELHSYCNSIGNVEQMFHYKSGVEPLNFIVVEFTNEEDAKRAISSSSYMEDSHIVPVQSQFLWFKATGKKLNKLKENKSSKLVIEDGNNPNKDTDIYKSLLENCQTVSDQMNIVYESLKLNDLGIRLRFLTARQIEAALNGMFPDAAALPFGSSVNGFGKMGCDLDLVLQLNHSKAQNDDKRLVFHCKAMNGSERTASQRNIEVVGDIIQLFLPGCSQVRKILQARVPIIKYYQQLTNVECDLSMANTSGFHMSDFLHIMGSIDERVRPLVFTIRKWASDIGLTNSSPGRWITNFSLTLLVLAFLQKPLCSPPVLPSLNLLMKNARSQDKYVTEDGINCTFLRDIKKLRFKTQNTESLESLLCEFFEFYSQFDFASKAISLNEAIHLPKPEHSAIYIVNPLERGLNVSKNVSFEELERFRNEAREAAWNLEASEEKKDTRWGLLNIFNKKRMSNSFMMAFNSKNRLMEVSTLFDENEPTDTKFKDGKIKKQVSNVKQETQNKIKELRKLNR